MLSHPIARLRPRVPVRAHAMHILQRRALAHRERETNWHHHFAKNLQRLALNKRVRGRVDPALHGILNRHHRVVDLAGAHHPQRRRHINCRNDLIRVRRYLPERRMAKRPARPEERKPQMIAGLNGCVSCHISSSVRVRRVSL